MTSATSARVGEGRTAADAGIFGPGRAGSPLSLTAARTVPYEHTSRRYLAGLRRVAQAVAESSPEVVE